MRVINIEVNMIRRAAEGQDDYMATCSVPHANLRRIQTTLQKPLIMFEGWGTSTTFFDMEPAKHHAILPPCSIALVLRRLQLPALALWQEADVGCSVVLIWIMAFTTLIPVSVA